jgi:hypothetical protein
MMHDREKSDPAIVAGKPTSKAGQPAAELVEPRAGANGNASRQITRRAQHRQRVSQALGRVRGAAPKPAPATRLAAFIDLRTRRTTLSAKGRVIEFIIGAALLSNLARSDRFHQVGSQVPWTPLRPARSLAPLE